MKLLLVEDNQTLAKLVAQKIKTSLKITVDIAYSMAQAQEFIAQNDYFLSILDLNLPDAPNGEIVGYIYSKKIPAIVLTASLDEEVRQKMFKKDVIDFVTKTSVNDVVYIVNKIKRILSNQKHKVMIVDDSKLTRRKISKLLRNQMFQVIEADDGVDALKKLEHDPDVRVVITDYYMPNMDGVELTLEIRKRYDKDKLSIIAISSDESELVSSRFLKFGASDFIKKPFSNEEFNCRINNTVETMEMIETIKDMQEKDFLTKTYNRNYFFSELEKRFKTFDTNTDKGVLALINIDNLKDLAKTHGIKAADKAIKALAKILTDATKGSDVVARFGNDEFAVFVGAMDAQQAFDFFDKLRFDAHAYDLAINEKTTIHFSVSIGLCACLEDSVEAMVNDADLKLYQAKHQGKNKTVS